MSVERIKTVISEAAAKANDIVDRLFWQYVARKKPEEREFQTLFQGGKTVTLEVPEDSHPPSGNLMGENLEETAEPPTILKEIS